MKRPKPPTERAIARHVDPPRAVLTAEDRATVEQCRNRDARDEDNSAILDRASLLAILDRIAPKG